MVLLFSANAEKEKEMMKTKDNNPKRNRFKTPSCSK